MSPHRCLEPTVALPLSPFSQSAIKRHCCPDAANGKWETKGIPFNLFCSGQKCLLIRHSVGLFAISMTLDRSSQSVRYQIAHVVFNSLHLARKLPSTVNLICTLMICHLTPWAPQTPEHCPYASTQVRPRQGIPPLPLTYFFVPTTDGGFTQATLFSSFGHELKLIARSH